MLIVIVLKILTLFYLSNKFLQLLLNGWNVKLKPVLIDWSVVALLGFGFMHCPNISLLFFVIFPRLFT